MNPIFRMSLWIVPALLGLLLNSGHAEETKTKRPNFIVFIADDMAWNDCGAYGHPKIRTPNIDRLAQGGMRFDSAFLTCSSCSPSRSSLITGRYPHNTGARQLHQPLPGDQVTFVELLKRSGYYTASAGKWHLGNATIPKFDTVHQKMNVWVKTLAERPKDKPFFMWFAFSDPHRGYQKNTIDDPHSPEDAVIPPFIPDRLAVRKDFAMYYDEITRLDGVVGRVMEELKSQGETDNTMVVFLSDNGRPFPRCKTTVYDSGIKTPWIVQWPGHVKPGSTTNSLISSIDLAPTVLKAAGLSPTSTFQGKSFLPILNDPQAEIQDSIFAEHNWHDFDDHGRAVRTAKYKYIRNYYTDIPNTPPADAVRSPTFQTMLELKDKGELTPDQLNCFEVPRPKEELYDLTNDPYELHNLAKDKSYTDALVMMRKRLDDWESQTGDAVPEKRRPDEFDRITGDRLKTNRKK